MAEKLFKVTLADGTSIDNLELNGNNFISQTEVTPATFAGKLNSVKIEGPEDVNADVELGQHGRMSLARCQNDSLLGGYAFVLVDVPQDVIEREQDRGDIEYIAMMTGVEL